MEWIHDELGWDLQTHTSLTRSEGRAILSNEWLKLELDLSAGDCFSRTETDDYHLRVMIKLSLFKRYGDSIQPFSGTHSLCCSTQNKILEIIRFKGEGLHRKLFLESNLLMILSLTQQQINRREQGCETCPIWTQSFHPDMIEDARAYILQNLDQGLSISQVSAAVGTNQCYLKKGFKEITGKTVFEFVQENRLQRARQLLENTREPVSQIALTVGYASLSSFSQAYKNFFGYSPAMTERPLVDLN